MVELANSRKGRLTVACLGDAMDQNLKSVGTSCSCENWLAVTSADVIRGSNLNCRVWCNNWDDQVSCVDCDGNDEFSASHQIYIGSRGVR